jgi:transcriptional regulator with XRE-family HTH domain
MESDIIKHIKPARLSSLPEAMRRELKAARLKRGWSQAQLGQRIGLPQMHISSIETGKIVPRFDTLLDFVRVLNFDLLMVPRSLVPAVQALIRDQGHNHETEERPLYAGDEEPEG